MADYRVVWDGRREGPGGSQLFATEQTVQPLPPARRGLPVREAALEYLSRVDSATMVTIVDETGCGMYAVNTALYRLREQGLVAIIGEAGRTRACRKQYLYALVRDAVR